MTCSQPGQPMIGAFATWRNVPFTFDRDTGSSTVMVSNYLRVFPNTSSDPNFPPGIEVGLYADKTRRATPVYEPRWMEMGAAGGRMKTIKAGVNPNKPDSRNHTYMTVQQARGNQWDVLYDFNQVGSTSKQPEVIGGNTNRVDVGLEVTGPQYVNVPPIANRMQFMTGNQTWQQVATSNVAKVVSLNTCSASHKPPYCFNAKLTDNSKFTQWTVSKPLRQPAAVGALGAGSAVPSPGSQADVGLPATFHGVDQEALQNCLANDPDSCLATVPGLSQCVVTVRICNAAALPTDTATDLTAAGEEAAPGDIRARAAAAFDVPAKAITVTSPSSPTGPAAVRPADDPAYTVTSAQPTPGLQHTGRRFDGFTARYSARTGDLLEACWGDLCDAT